jgi:hypothetical protein
VPRTPIPITLPDQPSQPRVDPAGEDPRPAGRAAGAPPPRLASRVDPTGEDSRPRLASRVDPRTGAPLPGPSSGVAGAGDSAASRDPDDDDHLARGSVNFRPHAGGTAGPPGAPVARTTTPPPGLAARITMPPGTAPRTMTPPPGLAVPRTTTPSSATLSSDTQPPRVRARGTPRTEQPGPSGEPMRVLVFAPEKARAAWIEGELARLTVTIQAARRVRTAVAALIKDPPPRPQLLIVDFDAVSAAELLELHAIRDAGWAGPVIGLGSVPIELRMSLGVGHVVGALVRDSLLDCIAGTTHGAVTVAMPVILTSDDDFDED